MFVERISIKLLIMFVIITFFPVPVESNSDDAIARNIIIDIKWNDSSNAIEVYQVMIQKYRGQQILVRYNMYPIYGAVDENKNWSDEEILEYVKKNMYDSVFRSDKIFGQRTEVFADLTHIQNVSEEMVEEYIEKAKQSILEDFENPPTIEEKKPRSGGVFVQILVIGVLLTFAILLFKIRNY